MIKIENYPSLNENMTTLKETSIDDRDKANPIYMTESMYPAVDFDKVKDEYIKHLHLKDTPKSNDALIEDRTGKFVFVEFKNGHIDPREVHSIRKKIYDSVLVFTDIVSIGISKMRTFVEFILVYNEGANPDIVHNRDRYIQESASFNEFAKGISSLANEEYVAFGMDVFKNYCFFDVHTYSTEEFEAYLSTL